MAFSIGFVLLAYSLELDENDLQITGSVIVSLVTVALSGITDRGYCQSTPKELDTASRLIQWGRDEKF